VEEVGVVAGLVLRGLSGLDGYARFLKNEREREHRGIYWEDRRTKDAGRSLVGGDERESPS
jgi:hypothetical protein